MRFCGLDALEAADGGEVYNICSGKGHRVGDVLEMLLDLTGVKAEVRVDPARLRPADVPLLVGDNTKFREKTAWRPEIPFEQTLADLVAYWRERI